MNMNNVVISAALTGGGHVKAAGCEMSGTVCEILGNLTMHIEEQLRENES